MSRVRLVCRPLDGRQSVAAIARVESSRVCPARSANNRVGRMRRALEPPVVALESQARLPAAAKTSSGQSRFACRLEWARYRSRLRSSELNCATRVNGRRRRGKRRDSAPNCAARFRLGSSLAEREEPNASAESHSQSRPLGCDKRNSLPVDDTLNFRPERH